MKVASAVLLALGMITAGCGDEENQRGSPLLNFEPQQVEVVDDFPHAGPHSVELTLSNDGTAPATLVGVDVESPPANPGNFELKDPPADIELRGGDTATVQLQFDPDEDHPSGCRFEARATLSATVRADAPVGIAEVPVVFTGECDSYLRCTPAVVGMNELVVGRPATETVSCHNAEDEPIVLEDWSVESDDDISLDVGTPIAAGDTLEPDEQLDLPVEVVAHEEGAFEALLVVRASDEPEPMKITLSGEAARIRPACSEDPPSTGGVPDEIDGYTFDLETDQIEPYQGQFVDEASISEDRAPMLDQSFLLADGAFLHEHCEVSTSGSGFSWSGIPCDDGVGTLYNIMPIALDEEVEEALDDLQRGDRVQFDGIPIERIEREGWWSPGTFSDGVGNRALFTARICDP